MKITTTIIAALALFALVDAADYGMKCHKGKYDAGTPTKCRQSAGNLRRDKGNQWCCMLPLSVPARMKKFQRLCTADPGNNPLACSL